jgi:hypothetical protein
MRDPRISEAVEARRGANFPLDDDLSGRANVAELLAEAGLELWQAPEGFMAVRLKQVAPIEVARTRIRRTRRAR